MTLSNQLRIHLDNAIRSYHFPLVTFDFENSRPVFHQDMQSLESSILGDLTSGDFQRVKDGLSSVLYWGFARKPGLQMKRVSTFREDVRPSQLAKASRVFKEIQGIALRSIKGIGLPQFSNMSFISKIRMFLDPNSYVVLDLKLRILGGQRENLFSRLISYKTYIPVSKHNEMVYEEWCQFCRAIANKYFKGTGIRAVDIERGIFHLVDSRREAIAADILYLA